MGSMKNKKKSLTQIFLYCVQCCVKSNSTLSGVLFFLPFQVEEGEMLNAKKCLKAGSILLAGTMLLSVFPMMTLAKPAIEVITHAGAGGGTDVNSRMMMIRA